MRVFARTVLAVVAAAAMSFSPTARADDKKDEKKEQELMKLLDEIEAAGKARKYEEGITLAKKAAELDPKNPAIPYAAGTAHLALRQNAEAVKALTEALKLEPKATIAYDKRGDAQFKLGNFKEAVADYDEYLKANPKHA